jgi:acyl carrier protein
MTDAVAFRIEPRISRSASWAIDRLAADSLDLVELVMAPEVARRKPCCRT